MKHIKLFETFEIDMGARDLVSKFGLLIEDIEDLFIDFSDMGYTVKIMKTTNDWMKDKDVLMVDVKGVGDKRYEELKTLIEQITRDAQKLGLKLVEKPRWVNVIWIKSDLRFQFRKL